MHGRETKLTLKNYEAHHPVSRAAPYPEGTRKEAGHCGINADWNLELWCMPCHKEHHAEERAKLA